MRILLLAALFLVVACDTTRPLRELHGIAAPTDPYRAAAIHEYMAYAQTKQDDYDWWDSKYFAEKGLKIADGAAIEPESLVRWKVAKPEDAKLEQAYEQLSALLIRAQEQEPERAAKVLVAYDRWLVLASESMDASWARPAQREYRLAMRDLTRALERKKPSVVPDKRLSDYLMGVAYFQGKAGYAKDDAQAIHYFQKSADAGDANGQYSLAYMYSVGQGVKQDWMTANQWMMKAAEQGHAKAMDDLGVSYGDGRGITQDWVECYKWITLAARYGDSRATQDLEYAKARMAPEQIARAIALADAWQKAHRKP